MKLEYFVKWSKITALVFNLHYRKKYFCHIFGLILDNKKALVNFTRAFLFKKIFIIFCKPLR